MLENFFPKCSVEIAHQDNQVLKLNISSNRKEANCPDCHCRSKCVHSHYNRSPLDLPMCGWKVQINVRAKRFRCKNTKCQRCTFVESFGDWLPRYAHRTTRLKSMQTQVAISLGGEAASRLLTKLGTAISPDSLLNNLRSLDHNCNKNVRVLGVDDFSFRKGKNFGTILVDLEKHRVIDLLEDRSAKTLTKWLKKHPEIEIISRDRSGEYARAANKGAPQAQQVADRWHLLVNLSEVIEKWLERHRKLLKDSGSNNSTQAETVAGSGVIITPHRKASNCFERQQLIKLENRERRFAQYKKAKELRAKGLSWNLVAAEVGKGSSTLIHWFRDGVPNKDRKGILDPYKAYLKKRLNEGCQNGLQLHREIELQGFKGTAVVVQGYLALLRKGMVSDSQGKNTLGKPKDYTPREGVLLFTREAKLLSEIEKGRLEHLIQNCDEARLCYELSRGFINMIHNADGAFFDKWLAKAEASSIKEFKQFAKSIRRDASAVRAGIELPWSNGMVEGKVNKLKLIKRMMYGRASFDLLKKRVLLAG